MAASYLAIPMLGFGQLISSEARMTGSGPPVDIATAVGVRLKHLRDGTALAEGFRVPVGDQEPKARVPAFRPGLSVVCGAFNGNRALSHLALPTAASDLTGMRRRSA